MVFIKKQNTVFLLFSLLAIFLSGFILFIFVHYFFHHGMIEDFELKLANEESRLQLGELIIHELQMAEAEYYQLAPLRNKEKQQELYDSINKRIAKIRQILLVLEQGGDIETTHFLILEDKDRMVENISYMPHDRQVYYPEILALRPKLFDLENNVTTFIALLTRRNEYQQARDHAAFMQVIKEIDPFLKKTAPFFDRLKKNTNRIHYNSAISTQEIKQGIQSQEKFLANFEIIFSAIIIGAGLLLGLAVARRITIINTNLSKSKQEADSANITKSTFLASMSHELRTPLNGILGYTQLLCRDQSLGVKQQDAVMVIQQSGEHLLMLINDILDLSKIEAGKLELQPDDFNLQPFLKSIADIVSIRSRGKGLSLRYQPAKELPKVVRVDEIRLRQILLNLLSNAVKFTEKGGVIFRVEARGLSQTDKGAQLTIRFIIEDSGVGVPPELQDAIFLPFQQSGDKFKQAEGTGLGLAISSKLLAKMGSRLHLLSPLPKSGQSGAGSRFWFDLAVDAPDLQEIDQLADNCNVISYRSTGSRRSPYKILIVDDNIMNRVLLADLLTPLGFITAEAADGFEAISQANDFGPDLICMDLLMPKMDGFAAAKQIRSDPKLAAIPIFAVSANIAKPVPQQSIKAGCDAFIGKPIQLSQLLQEIKRFLALEWICEEGEEVIAEQAEESSSGVIPPPADDLSSLLQMAMIGDTSGIIESLANIKAKDSSYLVFVEHIKELADDFRLDAIEEYISQFLEDK